MEHVIEHNIVLENKVIRYKNPQGLTLFYLITISFNIKLNLIHLHLLWNLIIIKYFF
jgi:hypothetical protein